MDAVASAISIGYRGIDTAHEYNNQASVGAGVRRALANASLKLTRDDIFVITKVEGGLNASETTRRLYEDVKLLALGPRLDLVLLHYPKAAPPLSLCVPVPVVRMRCMRGPVPVLLASTMSSFSTVCLGPDCCTCNQTHDKA